MTHRRTGQLTSEDYQFLRDHERSSKLREIRRKSYIKNAKKLKERKRIAREQKKRQQQ